MYKLIPKRYEAGNVILKVGQKIDNVIFVLNGVLEVYTELEGNEFLIEKLYSGSVLNYRSFILEDVMQVNVRCANEVVTNTLELNNKLFDDLMFQDDSFKKDILLYHTIMLKKQKNYPLDYIQHKPKHMLDSNYTNFHHKEAFKRKLKFKLVVFRRLQEIREIKKKPKLGDILGMFNAVSKDEKGKQQILAQLQKMYGSISK
jgi:signal-transduction protein with cAMP-binding, CBS, and nucleotidyltransferase domain